MKKIKYYIIAILCVFCLCLTFSGCTTNASYVEDSFTIKSMHYDTYYNELYVSFEFKIAVPKTGRYRVDYVIYQGYSENTIIAEGNEYNTLTVNEGEHSISSYIYLKTTNNAGCLLGTSPSPRDLSPSRMPSSA